MATLLWTEDVLTLPVLMPRVLRFWSVSITLCNFWSRMQHLKYQKAPHMELVFPCEYLTEVTHLASLLKFKVLRVRL